MRVVITLGILVALFISSGLYVQHYLTRTGKQLTDTTTSMIEAIHAGNWEEAQALGAALSQQWSQIGHRWGYFTEHDEIDGINGTLSRLRGSLIDHDAPGAMAEGSAALQLFQHIPEKEALTLNNIF